MKHLLYQPLFKKGYIWANNTIFIDFLLTQTQITIFLTIHVIQIRVKTEEAVKENQQEVSHVTVQTIAKEVNARFVNQA